MVCPKCVVAAGAGTALGTAMTLTFADKFPFLQKHPYVLPIAMGTISFASSSLVMTYTGYNIVQYFYNMFGKQHTDSNHHTNCHANEKTESSSYSYISINSHSDTAIISSTKCTEGTSNDEKFTLTQSVNHVFGRGGLDVFVLGDGEDHLYFSMCSTKIINGYVSTIYNFDRQHDKIYLFCTKKQLSSNDVSAKYNSHENITYIVIAGNFEETAIAVVGNYPNLLDNIDLNTKYADAVATGVCNEEPIEV